MQCRIELDDILTYKKSPDSHFGDQSVTFWIQDFYFGLVLLHKYLILNP